MAGTRGIVIAQIVRALQREFGPEGWQRILAGLDPEERRLVEGSILFTTRYPLALHMKLLDLPRQLYGGTRPQIAREIGRRVAEDSIHRVFRMFLRLGNPGFIVSRGPLIWKSYFDWGDLRIVANEPRSMRIALTSDEPTSTAFCESVCGWAEQAVTMSGGRNAWARETACQSRGAPACLIETTWD